MALGRYFSDLWDREEQPENEFMRDQGPGVIEEELRPYKRQAMEAGREENQGYWSKLLGRLGMGGPEEEVPADYGFENQDVDFSRPEDVDYFETAIPESTLRPPVDRKELARSGRNNSGILGALKKYAPLFGAATFDPRRRSEE